MIKFNRPQNFQAFLPYKEIAKPSEAKRSSSTIKT